MVDNYLLNEEILENVYVILNRWKVEDISWPTKFNSKHYIIYKLDDDPQMVKGQVAERRVFIILLCKHIPADVLEGWYSAVNAERMDSSGERRVTWL